MCLLFVCLRHFVDKNALSVHVLYMYQVFTSSNIVCPLVVLFTAMRGPSGMMSRVYCPVYDVLCILSCVCCPV